MNQIKRNQVKEALQIIIDQINNAPDRDTNDKALVACLIAVKGSIIERDELGLLNFITPFASKHRLIREMGLTKG